MSPSTKRTWLEVLRQVPTVTIVTLVFVGGGWKNHVDNTITENSETLCLYNEKGEALQTRVIELEALVREYRAQDQAQYQMVRENQIRINDKIDQIYAWMLEDRQ